MAENANKKEKRSLIPDMSLGVFFAFLLWLITERIVLSIAVGITIGAISNAVKEMKDKKQREENERIEK